MAAETWVIMGRINPDSYDFLASLSTPPGLAGTGGKRSWTAYESIAAEQAGFPSEATAQQWIRDHFTREEVDRFTIQPTRYSDSVDRAERALGVQ